MTPESTLDNFRASLAGTLLLPAETGYEDCRKIHNAMIDRKPSMIVRCADANDVIAAVDFARNNGATVTVRGAGHNVAGTSLCDGAMLIDLSAMKRIRVDADAGIAQVEPGVTWAEFNTALQPFGLAATGGYVGTTGVSGLTLGGGLGWMVRKHGCALDNLLSANVVIANGQLLKASATDNPDLFWGIRGGGGNFGIVTSFEFRVHPVADVLAGLVLHPVSRALEALRFWREFGSTASEDMTDGALFFNAPPELPVPDILRREPIVGIGGVCIAPLAEAEELLRPLRQFGPPAADIFQPMPYSAAQTMADWLWPRGTYNYWKSSFIKELGGGAFETMLEFYSKAPSWQSVVVLEHNGDGAFDRVPEDATAFGHRGWPYNFLITTMWSDPEETEANVAWTREFFAAMRPYLADAAYVNYLSEMEDEALRVAYGQKYQRLAALKAKYDPTNFFSSNHNIRPARAMGLSA